MKTTTTEILIEVEEIIQVKFPARKNASARTTGEQEAESAVEICPHCHRAILEHCAKPGQIEIKEIC